MTNAAHFLSALDTYADTATHIISLNRSHLPANVSQALDIAEQELSGELFDSPSDAKSPFRVITLYSAQAFLAYCDALRYESVINIQAWCLVLHDSLK